MQKRIKLANFVNQNLFNQNTLLFYFIFVNAMYFLENIIKLHILKQIFGHKQTNQSTKGEKRLVK